MIYKVTSCLINVVEYLRTLQKCIYSDTYNHNTFWTMLVQISDNCLKMLNYSKSLI